MRQRIPGVALAALLMLASATAWATSFPFMGSVSVDVAEPYPAGFGPQWKPHDSLRTVITDYEANFGGNRFHRPERLSVALVTGTEPGSPLVFVWSPGNIVCSGVLVGTDSPLTLGATPLTFKLSDITVINESRPCRSMSNYVQSWRGEVALSADPAGNVKMIFTLETFSNSGAQTSRSVSDPIDFKNLMSPSLARQERDRKEKEAAAAAQRAREQAERDAARQAEARRLDDLLRSLPPPPNNAKTKP